MSLPGMVLNLHPLDSQLSTCATPVTVSFTEINGIAYTCNAKSLFNHCRVWFLGCNAASVEVNGNFLLFSMRIGTFLNM